MKSLYTLLAFSIIGTAFLVSGCGAMPSQHPARTSVATATNTPISSHKNIWIEYTRNTAYQEHQGPTYWVLTNKQVNHIGQFLGAIDDPSTQSGWHSNGLSVGTKFFAIPGTPSTKAFAVQMKDGMYLEAVLVGSKKPS
ncbi:hypothetical protein LLE49_09675 [Alicyclobacillus tolerans]|uniref:hypothetical protein n=1 Tax=Alicyclobacillus tolerans TaxID=90970 RepID=UPI001F47393F|nr:hypothetical protein [Alicyclobacillus tolerans]MCF8564985.1 hypothetical protein [Alicyclobacillus tolerans]